MIIPEQYLHIKGCGSGETWIVPISDNTPLDLKALVKKWIENQFDGDYELDGALMPSLEGDYYARIMTDFRPPESIVCWTSGGFYIKSVVEY